ncbi:hypothetical protein [Lysinibacillus sp. NPDC093688]
MNDHAKEGWRFIQILTPDFTSAPGLGLTLN